MLIKIWSRIVGIIFTASLFEFIFSKGQARKYLKS